MSPTATGYPLNNILPVHIEGFADLAELALDLRWSWNHAADAIWAQLDPDLWSLTHNPWGILQTLAHEKIARVAADPEFRAAVAALLQEKRAAELEPAWFQQQYPQAPLNHIAYFSMEFMLSEALPIYSGGLGNVAGDQLKAASDLGVPVIGVGLLYQQGYFRQVIDANGDQQAFYPYNDPGQLPITPLRTAKGEWLRLQLNLPGHPIWLRAWQVKVGRVMLYLLDSNDAANYPPYRGITGELYGGTSEMRLMQELILGIGGWRLLVALGLEPEVCHLNEGHAALAALERARTYMQKTGHAFATALSVTRAGNLFTTHTAVAAGFDRFSPELIEQYLGDYARKDLGISLDELLALGREHSGVQDNGQNSHEDFNMAYLAIRASGAVNGVSELHGRVSRHLFAPLFPRWPLDEVPVGHVTNGIHVPSWDSAEADELWTQSCGKNRWREVTEPMQCAVRAMADESLWQLRKQVSHKFIAYARKRLAQQLASSGASPAALKAAAQILSPEALTLGFARRFAAYKRPNLLLYDPERLIRLLNNTERPVQLVLAGKAHPADDIGKALIRQWMDFIKRPEVRGKVVFLSDYDMLLTEQLVQGVDVWLNTPQRPWEASGTSGMKVLVNGGINLSELDGWWAEAYSPEVGWALGDGKEHLEDPTWDKREAEALYDLLEQQVVPEFYQRNQAGIPLAWTRRMRASMAQLTPVFSTNRVVREYTEQHYLPAARAFNRRAAQLENGAESTAQWLQKLAHNWNQLRFGSMQVSELSEARLNFDIQVFLGELQPSDLAVELFANATATEPMVRAPMACIAQPQGERGYYSYRVQVAGSRPAAAYTARIIPCGEQLAVPLEATFILWQR